MTAPMVDYKIHWLKMMSVPKSRAVVGRHDGINGRDNRKLGPDHAQRYLASFAWRYNRRYQLNTMIPRFVHSAARTQPIPYRALIAG